MNRIGVEGGGKIRNLEIGEARDSAARFDQITTRIFEVPKRVFPPEVFEKKKLAGEDPLDPLSSAYTTIK